MTVEYVDLKENMTVQDAIARIRQVGVDSETINICYVLDSKRTLVGTVALRYLLISPPDAVIGEMMHENVIFINTMMDQEEVARQFQKYDFTSMPVVDNENRLVEYRNIALGDEQEFYVKNDELLAVATISGVKSLSSPE